MRFERFHRVVKVVFAANPQQYSPACQVEHRALKGLERGSGIFRADFDPRHAVFADDAAPERVVEIDDQAFGGAAGKRHDETHPLARHVEQMIGCDGQTRHQPFTLVMPVRAAVARDQRVVVEHVYAAHFGGNAAQFAVDLAGEAGLSRFALAVEHAKARMHGAFERMQDERGLAVRAE